MVDFESIFDWYKAGGNIIQMLTKQYSNLLSQDEIIQISYDIQAGTYTQKALANPEFERGRGAAYAGIINGLDGIDSVVEIGVGEATSLTAVVSQLNNVPKAVLGFDISVSRIAYARKFVEGRLPFGVNFAVADMANSPLADNSVDLVYTVHALEPNGGNEARLLRELYRVAGKYLVLFEPSYELGGANSRQHIKKHNYVRGLVHHARELGYNVIENRLLFDSNHLSDNNTSVIVIEKPQSSSHSNAQTETIKWVCPITKHSLFKVKGCYYSPKANVVYPQIDGVPILLEKKSTLAIHFSEF